MLGSFTFHQVNVLSERMASEDLGRQPRSAACEAKKACEDVCDLKKKVFYR